MAVLGALGEAHEAGEEPTHEHEDGAVPRRGDPVDHRLPAGRAEEQREDDHCRRGEREAVDHALGDERDERLLERGHAPHGWR